MSNMLDVVIAVVFAVAASMLARSMMSTCKLPRWWWGIVIVPLLSIGMAIAVMLFPRPMPEGWQEGDFDTGRADFVSLMFFGALLPATYLALALPISLTITLWKSRREKT